MSAPELFLAFTVLFVGLRLVVHACAIIVRKIAGVVAELIAGWMHP